MDAAPIAAEPSPLTAAEFADRLDRLGPFEPDPHLAVAVSGGADSMALTLLAAAWAQARGGAVLGLIVDHGLRSGSAREAALVHHRLGELGIRSRVLTVRGLRDGAACGAPMAAPARQARYAALTDAARQAGIVHLLLGHHAADQAETRLMRRRGGSGPAGLAGMAALRETADLRLLRPLLDMPPDRLRALLRARGVAWIEDPSNADPHTRRSQARAELAQAPADAPPPPEAAVARRARDQAVAAELAERVMLSPLGYAVVSPGPIGAATLAALWQAISGRIYPPPRRAIAALAAALAPATLAGARLMHAGRAGTGWLLLRDDPPPPPVAACHGQWWDRFVLHAPDLPQGFTVAAAGCAAPAGALPAALRRLLPALYDGARLIAVPHLEYGAQGSEFRFAPAVPAAGAPFSLPFRDA